MQPQKTKQSNAVFSVASTEATRSKETILFYSALVRSHLEYCIQFFAWHFRKDTGKLKGVPRKSNEIMKTLEGKPYEEWVLGLGVSLAWQENATGRLNKLPISEGQNYSEIFQTT